MQYRQLDNDFVFASVVLQSSVAAVIGLILPSINSIELVLKDEHHAAGFR